MKQKLLFVSLLTVLITIFSLTFLANHQKLVSAPSTSVKDVLDNSQLSYFARIGIGPTTGDSVITVALTSGSAPSINTNNLFVGDTIAIGTTGVSVGSSGPLSSYIVKDIGSTGTITVNAVGTSLGIGQSNAFINAAIIATRSAQHVISWTPQSNAAGGFWQFLIKASSRTGEIFNDGIPDQQGFDIGASTPTNQTGVGARVRTVDVLCPYFAGTGTTAASTVGLGTTVAITAGSPAVTSYYNVFTCALGAGITNQVGVGYSMAIGLNSTSPELINPSPKDSLHAEGTADIYSFYVRHLDSGQNVLSADTVQGKIAVVESVRVTATVDPSITFQIGTSGVSTLNNSACGVSLPSQASSVTADAVPYGSLALGSFNDLAQWIYCVTNAASGYSVTVYENKPMYNINDGVTIPNTTCDSGTCSSVGGVGVTATWSTKTSASMWGFGMQKLTANYTPINIGNGTTYYAEPFGVGASNATVVMRNTSTPTAAETAFMCYRLTAASTQEAGNYEDKLVYTATSTF